MSERPTCLPVAAILLAAGSASRMGELKQLLPFRGKSLVEHAITQAVQAGLGPIVIVIGAESAAIRKTLGAQHVEIVENADWRSGMGSSIAAGARHLRNLATDSAAFAVLLADQPLVTASHLMAMRSLFTSSGHPIAAARYGGTLGVPAFFARSLLNSLETLEPEAGARSLLRDPGRAVAAFDLPEAAVDIDTPDDFAGLR